MKPGDLRRFVASVRPSIDFLRGFGREFVFHSYAFIHGFAKRFFYLQARVAKSILKVST